VRFSAVVSEAKRDVVSGTARVVVGFFCLAVLGLVLGLADLLTVDGLQRQAADFVAAGAATRGIAVPGSIDGGACDGLAKVSTVQASGAVASGEPLHLLAMPTVALQTYRVTPGFAAVVGIDDPLPGGVWLDDGLAGVLGAHVGDRLATAAGTMTVGGIFAWPQDGRDQRLSFAVLLPQPAAGLFDECWLKAWPVVDANDILLRATQVTTPGASPALIAQINKTLGVSLDANRLFLTRVTRWAAPVLLLIGLALGFAMARVRRLEYASTLHAGQAKSDQLLTCALETLVWILPATLVALAGLWATARVLAIQDAVGVVAIAARGPLLAAAGALIGALAACASAREKHLFQLFKNR